MNVEPDVAPIAPPAAKEPFLRTYHGITRTATYGFLAALPLLVFYEVLILLVNRGQAMQVRISAEVWMKRVLPSLGAPGMHALAVVVVLIGAGIYFYERRKKIPLRPRYFGWMVAESAVYAFLLAMLVSSAVGMIFGAAVVAGEPGLMAAGAPQAGQGVWSQLALSVGAGLYEELLFRVLLVGGMYAVLKKLFAEAVVAYLVAAVVGALLFSAVHYVGSLGDVFTLPSFTFRFLFGLALNAVFLVRGFGVAAWTHALYDVMIVTGLLG